MQKPQEESQTSSKDWDQIQKNLENSKQGEQMAWTDSKEDGGVKRQKASPTPQEEPSKKQ